MTEMNKLQLPAEGKSLRVNFELNQFGDSYVEIKNWKDVKYYITVTYATAHQRVKTLDLAEIYCDGSDWLMMFAHKPEPAIAIVRSLYPLIGGEIAE